MSAAVEVWLRDRTADVPTSLAQLMMEAAADVADDGPVSMQLAEASLACLRAALPHCEERSAALQLLAADALITYACEAAADQQDERGMDALAERFAAGRLAALVRA